MKFEEKITEIDKNIDDNLKFESLTLKSQIFAKFNQKLTKIKISHGGIITCHKTKFCIGPIFQIFSKLVQSWREPHTYRHFPNFQVHIGKNSQNSTKLAQCRKILSTIATLTDLLE